MCDAFEHGRARSIGLSLIPGRLEAHDVVHQRWIVQIGQAGLDDITELLQASLGLGRPFSISAIW